MNLVSEQWSAMAQMEGRTQFEQAFHSPKVVLRRLTSDQIKRYDQSFYENYCQPTRKDFMRSLGLISSHHMSHYSQERLKQSFPLRRIARIKANIQRDDSNRILLDHNISEEWKVKQKRKGRPLKKNGGHKKMIESELSAAQLTAKFPIGSPMFDRLWRTFDQTPTFKEVTEAGQQSISMAQYKSDQNLLPAMGKTSGYNRWSASSIERNCHRSELSVRMSDQSANAKRRTKVLYSHWMAFNRRQRLEKMMRIRTGLKWKQRLQVRHCTKLSVKVEPIQLIECTICCNVLTELNLCQHLTNKSKDTEIESALTEEDWKYCGEEMQSIEQIEDKGIEEETCQLKVFADIYAKRCAANDDGCDHTRK